MGSLQLLPSLLELALALHAALPQLLLSALSLLQAALQVADLLQGSLELLWTRLLEKAQRETERAGVKGECVEWKLISVCRNRQAPAPENMQPRQLTWLHSVSWQK